MKQQVLNDLIDKINNEDDEVLDDNIQGQESETKSMEPLDNARIDRFGMPIVSRKKTKQSGAKS